MTITPADIRSFANLPPEVPEALLERHIEIARGDLSRAVGRSVAPEGQDDIWAEALTVGALASVFPWLNTFALDGAAKVGRLEGSVEYRFLDTDDVEARVEGLNKRFAVLVAKITPATPDPETSDDASLDGFSMIAI